MANTVNFSVRMDSNLKKQCEALYGELGLSLTAAINVFLRQSLRAGGFPFDVRMDASDREKLAAKLKSENLSQDFSDNDYSDVEKALRTLME